MKRIVELNGMMGAGKSSIIEKLLVMSNGNIKTIACVASSYNKTIHIYHQIQILWSAVLLFFKIKNKNPKHYYTLLRFIYGHKHTWFYVNKSSENYIIIDEGIIQKTLSILSRTKLDINDNFMKIYNLLSMDRKVYSKEVIIMANLDIIQQRREERQYKQDIDKHSIRSVENNNKLFNIAIHKLNENKNVDMFDNNSIENFLNITNKLNSYYALQ
jgi:predicted ATPase